MPGGRAAPAVRLRSLDALRGVAVAAMILVNNQGGDEVYAPLRHALWNGCTVADLIFPLFLFVIGVAITLSLEARQSRPGWRLYGSIARRTLVLLGLGLFLNGFPLFDWTEMRFPGVLQRIALCYLVASVAAANLGTRALAGLWVFLVTAYSLALGFAGPVSTPPGSWIDETLLGGHLLHETWDPEGLATTLPAVATTLMGVLAGHWMRAAPDPDRGVVGLLGGAGAALVIGLLLSPWVPINKSLWTGSYVLVSGGAALCGLALCYWLIDVRGWRGWASPLIAYGSNPIAVYVLSSLFAKVLLLWSVGEPGPDATDLQHWIFTTAFAPLASPAGASLMYAVAYVLLWLGVAVFLYRREVFIKV